MSGPDALIAGRYRLVTRIATGGMGIVWQAWDELLQRAVAVKQLRPQPGLSDAETELISQRAMREARITARLHHQHAVPVYDIVEYQDKPCLVMQYLPSTSLQRIVNEQGPIPPTEAARIGGQVAAALAAAHAAGIVHRDVKPGNILIAEDGAAKITDFGISHALGDSTLTSTGMVTGTPAYLAPEVARGEESSFASDVFSLGATLYAATEGVPPFGSEQNPMAVLHRVASGRVNPPRRSGPLTPLLQRMLAADPAARPPMIDVAHTLTALHGDSAAITAVTTLPLSSPPPIKPPPLADPTAVRPGPAEPAAVGPVIAPAAADLAGGPTELIGRGPLGAAGTTALPVAGSPGEPPRVGPPVHDDDPEPRRSAGLLVALVVALLLIGAIVAGLLLLNRDNNTANPPATSPGSTSAPRTTAASSTRPSSTPAPSSSAPASNQTSQSSEPPASTANSTPADTSPSAAELAKAIRDYYALLPANTDEAWTRLTEEFQNGRAGGRDTYDAYWGQIRRVTVSDVTGSPPDTVVATVNYTYKDGRKVSEQTTFGLVSEDGVLKINSQS
ncbi:serine/threonine-protein kinase [Jatrophihabitans sp.]|uniref:serine/threonine-protein kinase n=1 Tax=Jatrophihabitans sp. TaxID=1932789 RepID=UPI002BFE9494|nr:protein kinase [Jatrophihabitans sp.]